MKVDETKRPKVDGLLLNLNELPDDILTSLVYFVLQIQSYFLPPVNQKFLRCFSSKPFFERLCKHSFSFILEKLNPGHTPWKVVYVLGQRRSGKRLKTIVSQQQLEEILKQYQETQDLLLLDKFQILTQEFITSEKLKPFEALIDGPHYNSGSSPSQTLFEILLEFTTVSHHSGRSTISVPCIGNKQPKYEYLKIVVNWEFGEADLDDVEFPMLWSIIVIPSIGNEEICTFDFLSEGRLNLDSHNLINRAVWFSMPEMLGYDETNGEKIARMWQGILSFCVDDELEWENFVEWMTDEGWLQEANLILFEQ